MSEQQFKQLRVESVSQVDPGGWHRLQPLVVAYWQEIMPKANVLKDEASRATYFDQQFGDPARSVFVTHVGEPIIGFMSVTRTDNRAYIEDFYVVPEMRRHGYGRAMVDWLLRYFDEHHVTQIDLNVRADTPTALAFWQSLGFGIAGYRLRQYRDPGTGTAYRGVLSSDFNNSDPP